MFYPPRRTSLDVFVRRPHPATIEPAMIDRDRHDAIVARLETRIAAQDAALAHARKTFDRASAAARIGVWECDLLTNALTWTDTVYDIFDLPRGSVLDRDETVRAYTPDSAARMSLLRSAAIAQAGAFAMEAELLTRLGNRRFVRLTASVETENGVPVRLFGLKQDITEERLLLDRTRYLANFDAMTRLANRTHFQARLADRDRPVGALLLVDLDWFKQVNDTHGHLAGDTCLRITADRLATACADADLVARIGGDEFAVVLSYPVSPDQVTTMAARIVDSLAEPVAYAADTLAIRASVGIGLARPGDSDDALFARADAALYAAKGNGRGGFRVG